MLTSTLLNATEQDVSNILSCASHIIQSGMPLWQKFCHLAGLKKLKLDFCVAKFSPA